MLVGPVEQREDEQQREGEPDEHEREPIRVDPAAKLERGAADLLVLRARGERGRLDADERVVPALERGDERVQGGVVRERAQEARRVDLRLRGGGGLRPGRLGRRFVGAPARTRAML